MASNAENVFIWWCHHVLAHSKSIRHIKIIHFFLFHIEGHIKLEQYGEKAHRRQIVRLSLYTANAMPADALVTLEARSIQYLLILWLLMSPEHQQALYWPSKPDYSVSSIRRVKGLIQIISSWNQVNQCKGVIWPFFQPMHFDKPHITYFVKFENEKQNKTLLVAVSFFSGSSWQLQ